MGFFDFFKKKGNISPKTQMMINRIKEQSDYLPTDREKMLFLDMVKGKRVEHIFYGNTSFIQENKRDSLKKWLYDSIKEDIILITSGNESIAQSLSKKELVYICANNGLSVSGNKIDLVNRIDNLNPIKFESFEVSNWFLLTEKGKNLLDKFKQNEKENYDNLQQRTYNLFLLGRDSEAINIALAYKSSYPFKRKGEELFLVLTPGEINRRIKNIRESSGYDEIGFAKPYINPFKAIMCMELLFSDVNVYDKFEEVMPGANEFIKRSRLIKNKELHIVDLRKLLNGEKVENIYKIQFINK